MQATFTLLAAGDAIRAGITVVSATTTVLAHGANTTVDPEVTREALMRIAVSEMVFFGVVVAAVSFATAQLCYHKNKTTTAASDTTNTGGDNNDKTEELPIDDVFTTLFLAALSGALSFVSSTLILYETHRHESAENIVSATKDVTGSRLITAMYLTAISIGLTRFTSTTQKKKNEEAAAAERCSSEHLDEPAADPRDREPFTTKVPPKYLQSTATEDKVEMKLVADQADCNTPFIFVESRVAEVLDTRLPMEQREAEFVASRKLGWMLVTWVIEEILQQMRPFCDPHKVMLYAHMSQFVAAQQYGTAAQPPSRPPADTMVAALIVNDSNHFFTLVWSRNDEAKSTTVAVHCSLYPTLPIDKYKYWATIFEAWMAPLTGTKDWTHALMLPGSPVNFQPEQQDPGSNNCGLHAVHFAVTACCAPPNVQRVYRYQLGEDTDYTQCIRYPNPKGNDTNTEKLPVPKRSTNVT